MSSAVSTELKVYFKPLDAPIAWGPLILASCLSSAHGSQGLISTSFEQTGAKGIACLLTSAGQQCDQAAAVIRSLANSLASQGWLGKDAGESAEVDGLIALSSQVAGTTEFARLAPLLDQLDQRLTLRSFLVGYRVTAADLAVWGAMKSNSPAMGILKKGLHPHLTRWHAHIASLEPVESAVRTFVEASKAKPKKGAANATFELGLEHAIDGQVVTRFPPEPSGYLHIGHAKAAMLNAYFAQHYHGRLLIRFDDTNPSKEKAEFEESIIADLALMEVKGEAVSYTSDYFDEIYKYAIELIKNGKAYADDTLQEKMRAERMDGIASVHRDMTVEKTLEHFAQMMAGTEEGARWCIRARMSVDNPNKAMRDPVIYRCNAVPHHRTGTQWKAYPGYDFACPVVDSLQGVTHALRTNEYRDRNAQYHWMLEATGLRHVHIWDYARLNFSYTLLSKRKLKAMVDDKAIVRSWQDPRMPTIRGIHRRGLTVEALRQFMLLQGPSQATTNMEWDIIWTLNKKIIDPIVPRYWALSKKDLVKLTLTGAPSAPWTSAMPKHKKNLDLGNKTTYYSSDIYIDQTDADSFAENEEITLMDWGNAFVRQKTTSGSTVTALAGELHLEGDFKKTEKKINWLPATSSEPLINVRLITYDYIITKKKLEEDDNWENFINPESESIEEAIADPNVVSLKRGDMLQLERKGYFIVDKPLGEASVIDGEAGKDLIEMIFIPDGRLSTVSLRYQAGHPSTQAGATSQDKQVKTPSARTVLPEIAPAQATESVLLSEGSSGFEIPVKTKMYAVRPVIPNKGEDFAMAKTRIQRVIKSLQRRPGATAEADQTQSTAVLHSRAGRTALVSSSRAASLRCISALASFRASDPQQTLGCCRSGQQRTMATSSAAERLKATQAAATMELGNTSKRDYLVELERKCQQRWQDANLFEVNAPSSESPELAHLSSEELQQKYPKFFGTFPYPYMNGSLHLGHGFTISKIEFAIGFERMLGKRALFPVAFHCTGMPIKSAADKLVREMEEFGPDFEGYSEPGDGDNEVAGAPPVAPPPQSGADATGPSASTTTSNVGKATKGKLQAKSTGLQYQFQIMESIDVPRKEIKKFADPHYWTKYFPPIAKRDLIRLGARVDWRRSFITTDINPYYDSFVRWQLNRLRDLQHVKFGERYTIYSPKDQQPCMDHDRASGEAVGPQEYTGLKLRVVQWSPASEHIAAQLKGKTVYMVAATLRPETMYGQTNCFVGNNIKYGVYAAKDEQSAYLITERSARNMAFQGLLREAGKVTCLVSIQGADLIGTTIHAPMSVYEKVYVLPMDGVSPNKGTGVVTSVPSDSPDDYATLMDLRKKPEYYKIKAEWAANEPHPVIETASYGNLTAVTLVKQLKINSQKDIKQLAEAKELAYREGFYKGTMVTGKYVGEAVEKAKEKVKHDLIEAGNAFAYAEPESQIISRSADECVVALMDQWYLDYGEAQWRAKAEKLLSQMETYSADTRKAFEGVLAWLNKWACARSYGLGTKLPWDPQFLVESLSDSTIYMAFYTIAHLLQGGVIDGSQPGPLGVTADQLTDEVWDHLLGSADLPANSPLPKEKADALRREFTYFYPLDIRSSGKDLIANHLTFCIYVHAALFPEKHWPRSMRSNGHLMLNGKKMSKSTGNSLTLANAIDKFGADSTRLTLADAGDSMDDANFEELTANANILRLHALSLFAEEETAKLRAGGLRKGDKNFFDHVFEQEIVQTIKATRKSYENAAYRDALKAGFYEFLLARDAYRDACADEGMHGELVEKYLRVQALLILPIAPHFAEHVWTACLQEPSSVQLARFPEPNAAEDDSVLEANAFVKQTLASVRSGETQATKKKAKGKAVLFDPAKPKRLHLFVANNFPQWQEDVLQLFGDCHDASGQIDDAKLKAMLTANGRIKDKRVMPFVQALKKKVSERGIKAALDRSLAYNQQATLENILPYLRRVLGYDTIEVLSVDEAQKRGQGLSEDEQSSRGLDLQLVGAAEPGAPGRQFWNV
ncbi:uncharacterized protein L969DRAFT_104263 [Mixia osmundae IAM 14324]|uniref:Glutamyl-tRNA synthetase n=1 Tax=Mixia osmundae (strain CBS 9802 / IAM 14324 / JCM 22182 / KY 12970) TaxID=764103 RepID=G7E7H9_MIXOS|nr:uncharacterized protein L969DRAFT_104263 [Mixia osmundae IAM 14324]KEI38392.1 hypothetical protein L969DRAFT_104263 [Mixia osmundae IAM 14324]GAA98789.1 hypothetical protein E5Q_05477 [Mixia osmundae IAM 14324]